MSHTKPSQQKAVEHLKHCIQLHAGENYTVSHEMPYEPWSNGTVVARFTWDYKGEYNMYLSGSCLVAIGPRGAGSVISYATGFSEKDHCRLMAGYLARSAKVKLSMD